MAGNSVPVFFGAKARTRRPPGLDVTSITDISASMGPFARFITSRATIVALENELRNQGIGLLSPNRYSFATGADSARNTLASIERSVKVNGVEQRWAEGSDFLAGTAQSPTLNATLIQLTEDIGKSSNIVSATDREYNTQNQRIIIGGSDEQLGNKGGGATPFTLSPAYPYIYVGVHDVNISISEPAGPNPVPSGTLVGFVYTTNTTGTAIYISGSTINYRSLVPIGNVTSSSTRTDAIYRQHPITTNGALYDIEFFNDSSFALLGTSLGNVLGKFLFETS